MKEFEVYRLELNEKGENVGLKNKTKKFVVFDE